ncbi:MAG TPA: translocation/assembly module TamB domain-containing protein [Longimicrobiales bacterium]|nr:translocation/assembly module TamB domain-containing protein [Longimicrobiales bacterium]
MARMGRTLRSVLIGGAVLVALLVLLFVILTRTDFGVERAGTFAVDRLRASVNGELRVGSVTSRGLLRGVTLHDVAIDDEDGRPFLRADSARLAYHLLTILGGDIAFDRLILHAPEVYIEILPGQDEWNYERVFPGDTAVSDTVGARTLVLIDDATLVDGLVVVRFPWEPDRPVTPADTARLILEPAPGGLVRVIRFENVDARIPRIVWESPDDDSKVIRIGELSARAYIWDTPADVRRLEGTVTIRDSLLSFEAPRVQLPSSEVTVVGRIIMGSDNRHYDIEAEGEDVSFSDMQWIYPSLPDEGGGALRFRIQTLDDDNILWLIHDARLRTGGSELAGSFGVVTGDTLYFANVDLEAAPLDLDLLRSLLPIEMPLDGLLIGTVEVEGPISALRTTGDLRYRRFAAGETTESAVRWTGMIRAREPYSVQGLDADLRRVDLGHLSTVLPALRLDGIVSGRVRADGSLAGGLRLAGDLRMDRDGTVSTVRGGGELAVGGNRSAFDLRFDAEPLGLDLLAAQFPALARLTGEARGPVVVSGSLDDLRVDADIVTPAGGVTLNGRFALAGPEPRYRAEGAVTDFQLDRVVDGIPQTTLTARFDLDGAGQRKEVVDGRLSLEIFAARVGGVAVHDGLIRLSAREGVAFVHSLELNTRVGGLSAEGSLGLVAGKSGELRFSAVADTLAPLELYLVPEPAVPDTAFFPPARLAGAVRADGVVRGSIDDWTVAGGATITNGVFGDLRARRVDGYAEWTPSDGHHLTLNGTVDSLAMGHRLVPAGSITGRYSAGTGSVELEATGPAAERLDLAGDFDRTADGASFTVDRLVLDTRAGRWELADTAAGRMGQGGMGVEPLVLSRDRDGARIEVRGVLPWRDSLDATPEDATFLARLENVRIGELLRLAQEDTIADGAVTGLLAVTGTALAPVIEGIMVTRGFRYGGASLDSVVADFRYGDRLLVGRVEAWRGDEDIIRGQGTLPLNLALTHVEDRRLDRPADIRLQAAGVPAGLATFLVPGFSRITGTLDGALTITGTTLDPQFDGELRVAEGSGFFEHSGVQYHDVAATARMRDTDLQVAGTLRTGSGAGEIRGTLDLARPGNPGFDLELVARQLDASRRRDLVAVADGRVRLRGSYSAPVVSGEVQFTDGQLDLGEIVRQYRIVQLEPWFYEVFDTTALTFRPSPETPFLANLRISGMTVTVDRDFWLRGPELNVEVAGAIGLEYDRRAEDLRLTGTLEAVRGTYDMRLVPQFPGRRFDIRDGTIEFVGTPGIDPNLAIAAEYRLRRPQGEPIDVVAEVAGTLQNPRVTLSSDTDLPISESDLASYILFGRSTSELSQAESDVLSSRVGVGGAILRQGVAGFVAPTVYGLASSGLQLGLQHLLPVDYVALTAAGQDWELLNPATLVRDAQLEVGTYAYRDLFLVGSMRIPRAGLGVGGAFGNPRFGVRAEWRFRPTWTSEFYIEDRFARTPSFGLEEIEGRTVWGLSLLREWGY